MSRKRFKYLSLLGHIDGTVLAMQDIASFVFLQHKINTLSKICLCCVAGLLPMLQIILIICTPARVHLCRNNGYYTLDKKFIFIRLPETFSYSTQHELMTQKLNGGNSYVIVDECATWKKVPKHDSGHRKSMMMTR